MSSLSRHLRIIKNNIYGREEHPFPTVITDTIPQYVDVYGDLAENIVVTGGRDHAFKYDAGGKWLKQNNGVLIPVDVLKFDRTFLLSFTNNDGALNKDAESVLELLIDLSKTLKKETVFEGVETIEQRDFLKCIDCDQAQGFFYSRPLSESDFMNYLSEEK